MSKERYIRRTSASEEFDVSLMYDDIEKLREIEEEEEKDQNNKLSFAGMMALVAGAALFIIGFNFLPLDVANFLQGALLVVGFGALSYGFYKTLKLAFRQKELSFPALNVYRKTRPITTTTEKKSTRNIPISESESSSGETVYRRKSRPTAYATSPNRKTLMRSRTNRVFSGVAGGIAEYMNISPALIRFAFIAALFPAGPLPVFVYLLLSIILPADFSRTYEERYSERGNTSTRIS